MDLEEQLELTRWAVSLVERDIRATVLDRPTIEVRATGDGEGVVIDYRIGVEGGTYGVLELGLTRTSALAEVAGVLQVDLCGMHRTWPACAEHERGLHAVVADSSAIWLCRAGPHEVARIGHLGG